jgi:hypothetical protein
VPFGGRRMTKASRKEKREKCLAEILYSVKISSFYIRRRMSIMCRPIYSVEIECSIKQSTLAIGVEPIIRRMSIHSHKINFI